MHICTCPVLTGLLAWKQTRKCQYESIGFGAMDDNLTYESIGCGGSMDDNCPYESMGFGAIDFHVHVWVYG